MMFPKILNSREEEKNKNMRAILAIIASAAVAALVLVSATVEGIAVEGSAVAKVEYFFGAA